MPPALAAIKKERYWLIANTIGLVLYVYFDSKVWLPPGLTSDEVAIGPSAITWITTAGPILLLFFLIDCVWLARRSGEAMKAKSWTRMAVVAAVGVTWLAALEWGRLHS